MKSVSIVFSCFLFWVACGSRPNQRVNKNGEPMDGKQVTLSRLVEDPPLEGPRTLGLAISPDAKWLTFLRGSEKDSEVLDLWGVPLSSTDQEPRPLVRATDILGDEKEDLSEAERMARERKRIRLRGLVGYKFCGNDSHNLLFTLGGDLYHVTPKEPKPTVKRLTRDGGAKLDSRCSPNGTYASFVRDGNVFAVNIRKKTVSQITKGATKTKTYGTAEFVAQEEMGRYDGHYWSDDERYLAYMEVDTSEVSLKTRPQIHADRTEMIEQRYPAAGEDNAKVSVWVRDLKTGKSRKVTTPKQDGYIPRVNWFHGQLYLQWQSRDQTKLVLYRAEAPKFQLERLHEETDEAWVELHNDLRVLKDGTIIWPSERSGTRQLYTLSGGKSEPLTVGKDPVTNIVAISEDENTVYFQRATNRSKERHFFSIDVKERRETQLTKKPGTHSVKGHESGKAFIVSYSNLTALPETRVVSSLGKSIYKVPKEGQAPWETLALPGREWIDVKAEDGTVLNGLLLTPERSDDKKYPVVVYVYGGPTAQLVRDAYGVISPLSVFLTQQGFGVFILDNRGTGNRDREFTRKIFKRVADIEVADQLRGVEFLKTVPWVDPDRIGVWGWSYGGTMASLLITEPDTPFSAAVAGAPVTDWRLYDTHYTERYLGKPQENRDAYERTDVVSRAKNLKKPYLLVHGTADDNVLFENSLRFIQALQKESAPFELMIYPGHAHGLRGRQARLHFSRMLVGFFARNLRNPVPEAAL